MITTRCYSANPESSVIEQNREEFAEKMKVIGKVGCEYIQKFSDSKISKYYSVVAVGYGDAFIKRVNYVSDAYEIRPFCIRKIGESYHAIYLLSRASGKQTADLYCRAIGNILSCEMQYYTVFSGYETISEDDTIMVKQDIIDTINNIFSESQSQVGDSINDQILVQANQIPANEVIEKLGRDEKVDTDMNIIIGYGFPFSYIRSIYSSIDSTFKFFNEHFDIGFHVQEKTIETYFKDGIISTTHGMYENAGGYSADSEKGPVKVTDFLIRVHYKIIEKDSTTYAISLINKEGKKTNIMKWQNSVSESSLIEIVQSQGNYHFINPAKKFLIHIHTMIASTEVPSVYVINRLGRNVFMGNDIIIYDNGVFDIARKKFFPKPDNNDFYFMDGTDGFIVQDMVGNSLADVSHGLVPSVKGHEIYKYDDYLAIFKDMYKDWTGEFLVMACMTYMGFALFSDEDVAYNPIFCGYGVTGSGKTTFAEFVKMMLGIDGLPVVFGAGTTNYALLRMLGTINKFPIMCSEFRAGTTDSNNKEAMFRSLYDRKPIIKGRADQTTISYDLIASLFMEGEELPNDGAVRSRFIHKRLAKRYRNTDANVDIHRLVSMNKNKIDSFVNSYQITAEAEIYHSALLEGKELLNRKGREPRIVDNISMMYASCMAFDATKKDYYLSILDKLSDEQHSDLEENGTGQQIMKVIGTYLASRFSEIYVDTVNNNVIFSWDDLVGFIRRQKIELTLQVDSYRDHLIELGWKEGLYEVEVESGWGEKGEIAVEGFGIHVSQVPQTFFKSAKVYKLHKQYIEGKKKK